MILVTGATGTIGSQVTQKLVERGLRPRVLVRSPRKLGALAAQVEVAEGELGDRAALRAALAGVDHVFLLSAGPELVALEAPVIEESRAAGVEHLVKLSVFQADSEAYSFARWHRAAERLVEASGLGYTFLRPINFSSNALGWAHAIKSGQPIYASGGGARVPVVDPRDVAEAAVVALTEPGHVGEIVELTGPEPLSGEEQVAALAAVLGKELKYVDVPPEATRDALTKMGLPGALVTAIVDLATFLAAAGTTAPTGGVERLTGRPARRFADWARDHADAFR